METTLTSTWTPATRTQSLTCGSEAPVKGTSRGAKRGGPMSTVTLPDASTFGTMTPLAVSTRISCFAVSPSSSTKRAKQRAPLPHCSTSPPSALKMR